MLRLDNETEPVSVNGQVSHDGAINFDTTVPRGLVHRASVAEVLLTSLVRRSDTEFGVGAQWPRTHSFYQVRAGRHDPLLVLESIRQAGLLVAHAGLGIPLDHRFVMRGMSFTADPAGLLVGDRPVELELTVLVSNAKVRHGHSSAVDIEVRFARAGRQVATGTGSMSSLPPAVYRRIRRGAAAAGPAAAVALPAPVAPALVGRERATDVVLSPSGQPRRWRLRVNPAHPVLFDHPLDHVPGMLLFEAMRQALHAVAGASGCVTACRASMDRFVELGAPATVTVLPATGADRRCPADQEGLSEHVIIEQGGVSAVRAEWSFGAAAAAGRSQR